MLEATHQTFSHKLLLALLSLICFSQVYHLTQAVNVNATALKLW